MARWTEKRTLQECQDILTRTPGAVHEIETVLLDGRIQRVYKNLPPSLRHYWLHNARLWQQREYVVFEAERYTYGEIAQRASIAASMLQRHYHIGKGDHVGIVSRNYPEWVVAWWACALLGAVTVPINAWLPVTSLKHCIEQSDCKIVILDAERASKLQDWLSECLVESEQRFKGVLVLRPSDYPLRTEVWKSMTPWDQAVQDYDGPPDAWSKMASCGPEDPCSIFFTSGTTGLPKGVLNTNRAFLTSMPNSTASSARHYLRVGEPFPSSDPANPQIVVLFSSPLFHVIGTTTHLLTGTALGNRLVMMRKWEKHEAMRLCKEEKVTQIAGVPYVVMELRDFILSKSESTSLTSVSFGGAPSPSSLVENLAKTRAGPLYGQGYGLTETNAAVATISGYDCLLRPGSTGLPCFVNDILIMDVATMKRQPINVVGEIWLRGPNVFQGYYKDPEATTKVMTKDGWFRSGDLGYVDHEGFLYIKDRSKDVIIRGGENIDSVSVENAFHADQRILSSAAVGIPDKRFGEQVAVAYVAREEARGMISEADIRDGIVDHLPSFAIPILIVELEEMPRNAAGKVDKNEVRSRLKHEWNKRLKDDNLRPRSRL